MPQFTPFFRPSSSRPENHEPELRNSSQGYSPQARQASGQDGFQVHEESVYSKHNHETGKLKALSFWGNNSSQPGTQPEEDNEWTERPSPPPFILIMIILVVVSSLIWFMFRWASGSSASPPPVILPDSAPFKIRPENPGGIRIPHQDKLVYGRLRQDAAHPVERLLPPPEQPLIQAPPPPVRPDQGQPYAAEHAPHHDPRHYQNQEPPVQQPYQGPMQNQPYAPDQYRDAASPSQPYAAQANRFPQAPVPYPSPAPVPYDQSYAQPQLGNLPEPASPESQVTSPVESIRPAIDEEEDTLLQAGRQELDQFIAREAKLPLKRTARTASKAAMPKSLKPSDYKVQIASLPSRSMAELEMKRLLSSQTVFLENRPWNIQKIELGPDRGVTYRLVIGSFANRESAMKYCKKLQTRKIGCMVINPANK